MMKRFICLALVCAAVLAVAPIAMAQQKPEPVIRIGDWVEIGNEVFMNIIAAGDIRHNNSHNMDFERPHPGSGEQPGCLRHVKP